MSKTPTSAAQAASATAHSCIPWQTSTDCQTVSASESASFASELRSVQSANDATATTARPDAACMTPNEMIRYSQELFDGGEISSKQHLMLLAACLVFGSIDEDGIYTPPSDAEIERFNNTPMDFLQYSQDRIDFLESIGDTVSAESGYEEWKELLLILKGL